MTAGPVAWPTRHACPGRWRSGLARPAQHEQQLSGELIKRGGRFNIQIPGQRLSGASSWVTLRWCVKTGVRFHGDYVRSAARVVLAPPPPAWARSTCASTPDCSSAERRPIRRSALRALPQRAQQGRPVGENADHLAAATDFAVDALERVGGPDLPAMLERKTLKGEDVNLRVVEDRDELGEAPLEEPSRRNGCPPSDRAPPRAPWRSGSNVLGTLGRARSEGSHQQRRLPSARLCALGSPRLQTSRCPVGGRQPVGGPTGL